MSKKEKKKIKVGVNGYGVIGKRVADAVMLQDDMELVGIADVSNDWRIRMATAKGYRVYASTTEAVSKMREAGIDYRGILKDLLQEVDVIIDATPKGIGAQNKPLYDAAGVKSIFQGGEDHDLTGVSFVAQANYAQALGKKSVRCVSCNTTGLTRIISPLAQRKLVERVRASLFRRGTDPWESHKSGMINTVVPEKSIPSHQGPDVQTILRDIDIVTIASSGPFNLSHLHTAFIDLTRETSREEIIDILDKAPRLTFVETAMGLGALNAVIELMRDMGRPRNDLWEVVIWKDILEVKGRELYLAYQVHNEAIVIPENIDAIRAVTKLENEWERSIAKTDASLGIKKDFLS